MSAVRDRIDWLKADFTILQEIGVVAESKCDDDVEHRHDKLKCDQYFDIWIGPDELLSPLQN